MYGPLRFLYNNLITSYALCTLSSQATGRISGVAKDGSGVATFRVSGPFSGAFDLSYFAEVDSVSGGKEIGQATLRWRTSDTAAGTWEETGVLTRTEPAYALNADGLGTSIKISQIGGTGNDFELGDDFWWKCKATYGIERILDRSRMTYWKATGDTSENIVIDLGSAQNVTAFILHDHNLTDSATVTLQGHTADSWGSPDYENVCTIQDPIIEYLDETYRYWRILIADATNPDGYIQAANVFLGTYLQLTQPNANWGGREQDGYTLAENESEPGVLRKYVYAAQQTLQLSFGRTLSNTDVTSLITMQEALLNTTTHVASPLWVHLFSDVDSTLKLMDWQNIGQWTRSYSSYLLNSNVSLTFREIVTV
jgi:hypothetical protein